MDIEREIMSYRTKAPAGCLVTSKWGTRKERELSYNKKKDEYMKSRIMSEIILGGKNAKKRINRVSKTHVKRTKRR